jgi:hypothetical protein
MWCLVWQRQIPPCDAAPNPFIQVVVLSETGKTPRLLAKYRPPCPVLVVTSSPTLARTCACLYAMHVRDQCTRLCVMGVMVGARFPLAGSTAGRSPPSNRLWVASAPYFAHFACLTSAASMHGGAFKLVRLAAFGNALWQLLVRLLLGTAGLCV